jgi:hypothetical protein
MKNIKFITETSEKGFINPFTGRGNSTRVYAVNSEGKKGYLPNETKPYTPIGGKKALLEVLDILVWS